MYQALIIVHVLVAAGIVALVLLQQGRGADAGAAFGSGASGTVFGAQGSASFLTRVTGILAVMFFATSLGLAIMGDTRIDRSSFMDEPVREASEQDLPPGSIQRKEDSLPDMPTDIPLGEQKDALIEAIQDAATNVENNESVDVQESVPVAGGAAADADASVPAAAEPTPDTEITVEEAVVSEPENVPPVETEPEIPAADMPQ